MRKARRRRKRVEARARVVRGRRMRGRYGEVVVLWAECGMSDLAVCWLRRWQSRSAVWLE